MFGDFEPQSGSLTSRLPAENISQRILTIRGYRVMLDADLAALYNETPERSDPKERVSVPE
jgi:hypothetical protein